MTLTPMAAKAAMRGDAQGETRPVLAVAICTRARPDRLGRALASLATQTSPLSEIIVIDDARDGEPDAASVVASFDHVHYMRAAGGLDVARNAALTHSRADVVAFLDDDAVAHREWARLLSSAFTDPAVGACTGRVDPLELTTPGQVLFEANGGFGRGRRRIELPRDARRRLHGMPAPLIAWAVSVGSGCSLAVRRSAALDIGGFDEKLDNGATLPGGGDHDMLWRLLQNGWKAVYEPDAIAWHEHRTHEADAISQIVGHQRALVAFLTKSMTSAPPRHAAPIALFLAWRLLKPGVRLMRRAARRDALPAHALLRMWAECWRGLSAYNAQTTPTNGARVRHV